MSASSISSSGWPVVREHLASHRLLTVAGAVLTLLVVTVSSPRAARADILAAYVQGHGGLSSPETSSRTTSSQVLSPGIGVQAGARLLIFEGYGDYTSLGAGSSVSRGIVGLRGGFGLGDTRLVLRVGAGVLTERGGAVTGHLGGFAPDRTGPVARAGIALERRVAPALLFGGAIDGEVFTLDPVDGPIGRQDWISGSDVFFSLHLKFEIGI